MKAIPRKTAASKPIPFAFYVPPGAKMGYSELRHDGRVVARIFPEHHYDLTLRDGAMIATCDWKWELLDKAGEVVASGKCPHQDQACERAWQAAEGRRKKETI